MVMTTVLVDCATCEQETEAKYNDCDGCYEKYLDVGGDPAAYDDTMCEHMTCLDCQQDPFQ